MEITDRFSGLRPISVVQTTGVQTSIGYVHEGGAWAVHEHLGAGYVELVHLQSGTALPARFSDRVTAMRACHEIAALQPDWSQFNPRTASRALKRSVRAAVDRQHGVWFAHRVLSRATAPIFDAAVAARRSLQ